MFIRYQVLGTLDFTNLHYLVVFNTTGNGQTPYAPSIATYTNYSFILVFGGTQTAGAAYAVFQVVNSGTSAGFTTVQLPQAPQYVTSFNPNSSGTGNQFTFTFNRLLLTPLVSASPSPGPTATPNPYPTLASGVSSLWAINIFSADVNNNPIDAISNSGVNDVTFNSFVINTLLAYDVPVYKPSPPPVQVTNPNAQVMAVEIINSP
jgi:hypothetical protein